jgi:hypothetical protein
MSRKDELGWRLNKDGKESQKEGQKELKKRLKDVKEGRARLEDEQRRKREAKMKVKKNFKRD